MTLPKSAARRLPTFRSAARAWQALVAVCALGALGALSAAPAHADPLGHYRGWQPHPHKHYHARGWNGWAPLVGAVVIGAAAAQIAAAQTQPQVVVLPPAPPPPRPVVVMPAQPSWPVVPAPVQAAHPDWIVYPREGQSPAQLEADRLACQQWAQGVPGALINPAVLRRAEAACLDGRGYTVR